MKLFKFTFKSEAVWILIFGLLPLVAGIFALMFILIN
jgi:hypothetical protein